MRLVRNVLEQDGDRLRARATDQHEDLPVGMVFRSVGYRGVPLADMPFDDRAGIVPNVAGRVVGSDGSHQAGLYVSGWIKRGPSGVIGTNKPDGKETADAMLQDAEAGRAFTPESPYPATADEMIRKHQPSVVSYDDWRRIDGEEVARGEQVGRPRVKFTDVDEMLAEVGAGS